MGFPREGFTSAESLIRIPVGMIMVCDKTSVFFKKFFRQNSNSSFCSGVCKIFSKDLRISITCSIDVIWTHYFWLVAKSVAGKIPVSKFLEPVRI